MVPGSIRGSSAFERTSPIVERKPGGRRQSAPISAGCRPCHTRVFTGAGESEQMENSRSGDGLMRDALFILLSIALFYLAIRYVDWSDRV
jgi:hypothetical protein